MSDTIRDFRDLIIWRKSIWYARDVYLLTDRFPPKERFGLTAAVRRSAVAVSSHIAEGHTRLGGDFIRYLSMARGSLAESESQLLLAVELGFVPAADVEPLISLATEIRLMAIALLKRLDH